MKSLLTFSTVIFFYLTAIAQNPLTDSLIAYYPFNGNANDATGNGNNGTVYGATLTTDRFGNPNSAYYFNGISDSIVYTPSTNFHPAFPVSITAWIKSNSNTTAAGLFDNNFTANLYSGVGISINPAEGGVWGGFFGDNGPIDPGDRYGLLSSIVVNDNQWHFIAFVVRGYSDMDLYVDCSYDNLAQYSGYGGPMQYINAPGQSGEGGTNAPYQGVLDEIRFYSRALTQTDLQLIYSYPKPYDNLSVTLGSDTTIICTGSSAAPLTLKASVTGNVQNYNWSNGATSSSITISQPGNYSVTVFDGCSLASDTVKVRSTGGFVAGQVSSGTDTICPSTLTTLNLTGNSAGAIQWQSSSYPSTGFTNITGASQAGYTTPPINNNTYYRAVVGAGICADTSAAVEIAVIAAPFTGFSAKANGQQVSFSSAASQGIISYYWSFGDGQSDTTANPVHTYSKVDTFDVCLTVKNNTDCNYTICQNVVTYPTGIDEINNYNTWLVYPDPFSTLLYISTGNGIVKGERIEVFDMLGRRVSIVTDVMEDPFKLDLTGLKTGAYFIRILTSQGDFVKTIIKE